MSELTAQVVVAPLAKLEDWGDFGDYHQATSAVATVLEAHQQQLPLQQFDQDDISNCNTDLGGAGGLSLLGVNGNYSTISSTTTANGFRTGNKKNFLASTPPVSPNLNSRRRLVNANQEPPPFLSAGGDHEDNFSQFQVATQHDLVNKNMAANISPLTSAINGGGTITTGLATNKSSDQSSLPAGAARSRLNGDNIKVDNAFNDSNFMDNMSGSLEDLVNCFDEKITNCFRDYSEETEKMAPVQIRSQEEIINDCQMWWTLTGNFGNILPIDWTKTYARKLQLPTLNLNVNGSGAANGGHRANWNDLLYDANCDEEELAKDLDMHSLILNSLSQEPVFTAEQVLEEIDELMQDDDDDEDDDEVETNDNNAIDQDERNQSDMLEMTSSNGTSGGGGAFSNALSPCSESGGEITPGGDEDLAPLRRGVKHSCQSGAKSCGTGISSMLHEDKLRELSSTQLNELNNDLERMIQGHSEVLIEELALRDELEFEKELKNSFISLLLTIQNKRRQHHMERKKGKGQLDSKYLTTVIPYDAEEGPPTVRKMQVLIKILKAINDDSPTVPTLLTDYILKVLCPT